MHLRLVVGGLLTRDPVLCTLLVAYADRLQWSTAPGARPSCFIVPRWTVDGPEGLPGEAEVLTVQVHAARGLPGGRERTEEVWRLVQSALTGERAVQQVRARSVGTPAELVDSHLGSVCRARSWQVAVVSPVGAGAVPRRWVPWPGCDGPGTASSVTPCSRAASLN